jgi:hypothetical protein
MKINNLLIDLRDESFQTEFVDFLKINLKYLFAMNEKSVE